MIAEGITYKKVGTYISFSVISRYLMDISKNL